MVRMNVKHVMEQDLWLNTVQIVMEAGRACTMGAHVIHAMGVGMNILNAQNARVMKMFFKFLLKQSESEKSEEVKDFEKTRGVYLSRRITRAKNLGVSLDDLPPCTNLNTQNNEAYILIVKYMKEGLNRRESTKKAVSLVKGANFNTLLCNWKRYRDELTKKEYIQ